MSPKSINQNIIYQMGLDNAPLETKKELVKSFAITVFESIMLKIAGSLNDEGKSEMKRIISKGDEEEVGQFIKDKAPNIDILIVEESLKFKQMLVEKMRKLDGELKQTV